MSGGLNIAAQAENIRVNLQARMHAAAARAVNMAAADLYNKARRAASGTGAHREGKRLHQAIRRSSATEAEPRAVVYLDTSTSGVPHAAAVHENRNGYSGLRNKSGGKYMYLPITRAGTKHALHAKDSQKLGLKGWLNDGRKSMPVGAWTENDRQLLAAGKMPKIDFVLKRTHDIPPNKRAGFLTDTAERNRAHFVALMRTTVWDILKHSFMRFAR